MIYNKKKTIQYEIKKKKFWLCQAFCVQVVKGEMAWQIPESVHTKKGHIHISSRGGSTVKMFSKCHHAILYPVLHSGSLPLSWEDLKKMVMRLSPPGRPRNKQWFSQKSRHYSQTLFLLCPPQGPPVWESCGCGVKNKISMVLMRTWTGKYCLILIINHIEQRGETHCVPGVTGAA